MNNSIEKNILFNMNILVLITILITVLLTLFISYKSLYDEMEKRTKEEAELISKIINYYGDTIFFDEIYDKNYFGKYNSRITIINNDGEVIYDSTADIEQMENHINRPEIIDAFESGKSTNQRISNTLGKMTIYTAFKLNNGNILRVSKTIDSVFYILKSTIPFLLFIIVIIFFISLLLSKYRTQKLVQPINNINLNDPKKSTVYNELNPLIDRMEKQNIQIQYQIKQLDQKGRELLTITENMKDGLVLLNYDKKILSINKKGMQILNIKSDSIGKHILKVNRNPVIAKAIKLEEEEKIESYLESDSRIYQVYVNFVKGNYKEKGIVLFMTDVTERIEAEKLRREFSANVSHELKTPLTSISGYAEIMKNGLVKENDILRFSEKIYDESKRLLNLINDILKLSKLDESSRDFLWKKTDIYNIVVDIKERLLNQAELKNISINIYGEKTEFNCIKQIMEEVLFNLIENAIKYNINNGNVDIILKKEDTCIKIIVNDTGIGIEKKYQERIFERFYRIDKSHSKETGGTGLGLSIVKHGIACHNGKIKIDSVIKKGTKITVSFPKKY